MIYSQLVGILVLNFNREGKNWDHDTISLPFGYQVKKFEIYLEFLYCYLSGDFKIKQY